MKYKVWHVGTDGSTERVGPIEGYASLDNARKGIALHCQKVSGVQSDFDDKIELVNLSGPLYNTVFIPNVGRFNLEETE